MGSERITRVVGAVNIGSFRISAMIAGITDSGELIALGAKHRAAQGVKRGYVTDMTAATYAVRDAIERAEHEANTSLSSVVVGCSGAGLASQVAEVEIEIGGRRIAEDDVDHLLISARDIIRPDGQAILHATPAHYTLDGAHGVANPCGLHAERLGVNIHIMLADGAPLRNLTEAVQNAHLDVDAVVASPVASGYACLTAEERELGVALIEFGAEVTNVAVYTAGMLLGLTTIPMGSGDITDAIASAFGIRRYQAERLKTYNGSAIASPADHREKITVAGADGEPVINDMGEPVTIPRADFIAVITSQLARLMDEVNRALKGMGFAGAPGRSGNPRMAPSSTGQQVVLTGGGAELAGLADYAQAALGHPVRIGRVLPVHGLPEAHSAPGCATLAGLVLYAAAQPIDVRRVGAGWQGAAWNGGRGTRNTPWGLAGRVAHAMRAYF